MLGVGIRSEAVAMSSNLQHSSRWVLWDVFGFEYFPETYIRAEIGP
jgi:hypothetical protein